MHDCDYYEYDTFAQDSAPGTITPSNFPAGFSRPASNVRGCHGEKRSNVESSSARSLQLSVLMQKYQMQKCLGLEDSNLSC